MRSLFLAVLGGLCIGGACFAAECWVAIPLERLVVSGDGMAMLDEDDGIIELENVHHGEGGFYTLCQVEFVGEAGCDDRTLTCSPANLVRIVERYLSDPDLVEQFFYEITYGADAAGGGGADYGAGVGKVTVEDKDKKWKVEVMGKISHDQGQTHGSAEGKLTLGY